MANDEQNQEEGKKTTAIAFSKDELLQNLSQKDRCPDESGIVSKNDTNPATMGQQVKKSCSGAGLLPLLVAVYFIISGCFRIHESASGSFPKAWGDIMLSVGAIVLVCKIVTIATRK